MGVRAVGYVLHPSFFRSLARLGGLAGALAACSSGPASPSSPQVSGIRLTGADSLVPTIGEPSRPLLHVIGLRDHILAARRTPLQPLAVPLTDAQRTDDWIHPDLVRSGGVASLTLTGYPLLSSTERTYDTRSENPFFVATTDWVTWKGRGGVKAPLFTTPNDGYNSDGAHLIDPQKHLTIAFNRRVVDAPGGERNILEYRTWRDGAEFWTPIAQSLSVSAHRLVSPDFVYENGKYTMWSVNAGIDGCRAKSTAIERYVGAPFGEGARLDSISWGKPALVDWVQPGWTHWHIDVARVGKYYLGLSAAYPVGTNCTRIEIFAALSDDGVRWVTLNEPLERVIDVKPLTASLYRATSAFDEATKTVTIAYSAVSAPKYAWENYRRDYDAPALLALFRDVGRTTGRALPSSQLRPAAHAGTAVESYREYVRRGLRHPG